MTTPRDYAPVLDRLLQREVSSMVEVAGTIAYVFDAEYLGGGSDRLDDGTWVRNSDTQITIGLNDSNGIPFPVDLAIPTPGVEVSWDGGAVETLSITALLEVRTGFNLLLTALRLDFDGALPAAGTALTITVQTGGTQTVTQTVQRQTWAARRDFMGRDVVQASDTGLYSLADSRFIVRAEGPAWDEGDTFIDDEGVTRTVRGVAQIGRSRYLELLARSIG